MASQTVSASYSASVYSGQYYSLSSPTVGEGHEWYYVYDLRGLTIDQIPLTVDCKHNNPYQSTVQTTLKVTPYKAQFSGSGEDLRVRATVSLGSSQSRTWTVSSYNTSMHTEEFTLDLNTTFTNSGSTVEVLLLKIEILQGYNRVTLNSVPSLTIEESGDTPGGGDEPVNPGGDEPGSGEVIGELEITNISVGQFDPVEYGEGILGGGQSLEISISVRYPSGVSVRSVTVIIENTNGRLADRKNFTGSPATLTGKYSLDPNTEYYASLSASGERPLGDNIYTDWSGSSLSQSFRTGSITYLDPYDVTCSIVKPKSGNKRNGAADIPFSFTVSSQGRPSAYEAEYTTDGGETWKALASGSINGESEVQFTVPAMTLPSGSITWQVRAKANGNYTNNWASSSFTVTYEGYGAIKATSGPINRGVLSTSPITFAAAIEIIGQTADTPVFQEAKFYWRSGEANSFVGYDMTISNGTAQITIPVDTFPVGLVQWYMYGKDSGGVESETPIYATYVLKSIIDSFPVKPSSSIEQTENAIEFSWGYISLNGEALNKAEIQFSEDGVTWGTIVPIEAYEEEAPLNPPSGEDIVEEEAGG